MHHATRPATRAGLDGRMMMDTKPLSASERKEWDRLSRKWATMKATRREMDRCRSLAMRNARYVGATRAALAKARGGA